MAITAASLVATVSMEGATAAQEQLAQLGSSASQAQSRLDQMQQGEGEASSSLAGRFVGAIKGGVSGLLNFGSQVGMTVMGFKGLYDGAVGLASGLLSSNASMEQTRVAFTTLLGSSKAAGDYLQQLQAFAASTPFEFPEVATAAQHMIAFGFSAKDVLPALTDIGDAMSAMGKGSADVDHIVEIFGQMKAAGKVTAQDMMQMASEGIPAWKYLAEAMGKTVPEVQKLSSQGLIPADVAIKDIEAGMHKAFGGGMQAQAMTFNGLLSTFKDNVGMAWRAFTGPLFEAAKQGLTTMGNLVSAPAFQNFATNTGKQIATVFGQIGQFIQSNVVPAFQGLLPVFQSVMGYLKSDQFAGVIADFQTLGNQVLRFVGNIGMLAGALAQSAFYNLGPLLTGVLIPAFDAVAFKVGEVMTFINDYLSSDAFAGFVADAQTVFNQLIQIIIELYGVLSNLPIDSFINGFLGTIGPLITGVVMPALDALMFDLGQFLMWLQQAGPLQDVVRAGLIGIGAAFLAIKIGAFIATIPTLVAGFIAWAGAAWTAAAGTIAATWPLLAIGAVIAIVVAGIVLAIQHWGDITKWFQGVWGGFTGWLGGTLQAIGGFFSSVWGGILAGLQAAWNGILAMTRAGAQMFSGVWNAIGAGLQAAWNGIVTIAKVGAQLLFTAIFGQIVAIVQVFQWLYNHNYYFKDLVDAIVGFMQGCMNWLRGAWNDIANWLAGVWHGITGTATSAWNGTGSAITSATNPVLAWLRSAWSATVTWLSGVWNGAVGIARSAWNAVSSAIMSVVNPLLSWLTSAFRVAIGVIGSVLSTVGGYASAAMSALVGAFNWGLAQVRGIMSAIGNAVVAPLAGLVGQAFSWGSGIISGFIDGIRSQIGAAGQAAADVAQNVGGALGFHDVHLPGFASGTSFAPGGLAVVGERGPEVMYVPRGAQITPVSNPQLRAATQSQPTIIVQPAPIYLDGRALAQGLMPYVASQIRYGTGVR